ncbi:MAG: low molecular weight phosphotyrosine protein phosphatase [Muribaculaceae bacterium]|nr:low molecular weight phosphotyrosine protein phosphatase [Muribaculaceae bacterium]
MDRIIIDKTARRLAGKDQVRILFVCLGNICRSPAADGVMRSIVKENGQESRFLIDSAGTGGYHIGDLPDQRMRVHARRRGLELTHICRQVRESDFDNFDLIVGMDESNLRNLRRLAPTVEAEAKIVPMAAWVDAALRYDHIPDPYYDGAEGFETVLDLLQNGCQNLYNSLS